MADCVASVHRVSAMYHGISVRVGHVAAKITEEFVCKTRHVLYEIFVFQILVEMLYEYINIFGCKNYLLLR